MAKIQADQIEVGAGPQHSLPKYGPGPGWELQASRITDNGAVINVPGEKVQIGDFDIEDSLASTGMGFDDDVLKTLAITGRRAAGSYGQLLMEYETAGQARLYAEDSSRIAQVRLRPGLSGGTMEMGFSPTDQGTVTIQANTISLNAANVDKNDVPLGTVATVSLLAQTGNIVDGNLLINGSAAVAAGLYRLSYYLVTTVAGASGTVKATFTWVDPADTRVVDSATINFGTLAAPASGSLIIRSVESGSIGCATTVTSPVGDPEYALYITLERLQ